MQINTNIPQMIMIRKSLALNDLSSRTQHHLPQIRAQICRTQGTFDTCRNFKICPFQSFCSFACCLSGSLSCAFRKVWGFLCQQSSESLRIWQSCVQVQSTVHRAHAVFVSRFGLFHLSTSHDLRYTGIHSFGRRASLEFAIHLEHTDLTTESPQFRPTLRG